MSDPFADLPREHFGAILADCPWRFETWNKNVAVRARDREDAHYQTMPLGEIMALPVEQLAKPNCVLFLWVSWPMLQAGLDVIEAWGFEFKTCGFDWMKADVNQLDMFRDDADALLGMGFWTRANTEPCLLATRGKPKRVSAAVRMGIIEPRREHSRKPACTRERIEQLVPGPYLELFSRERRLGWTTWGNETDKFRAGVDAEVGDAATSA